ncbi:unnamed protein product [Didymodactylos carnosus]|uniref:Uncharacterized protein n=1 Tax=Didymodactylos carnosus TaxID=1234261 RepID=A0A815Q9V7_9BILA|nr:unnamed protein product [Didymodactylos carnosus]CAF4330838.1 unnamed protein product [Didymodactylos carnosus]
MSGEFKALDLAQFIDEKYNELTAIQKQIGDDFIRSERSCRVNLRRWGAKFEANSQRLYFEGDERNDAVKHRNEFIDYFLPHKDFYYTISNGDAPMWNIPAQNFGKNIGTRCPIKQIEYIDENGAIKVIDCYFQRRENKDRSKGLVELCKDLDIQLPDKAKLKEMHEILSTRRAFQNVTKLEMLAVKYSIELPAPYLPNPSPSSS